MMRKDDSDRETNPDALTPEKVALRLDLFLLGLVEFESLLVLQDEAAREVEAGGVGGDSVRGIVLLCEHPLELTMGREASAGELVASEEELRAWGLKPRWLARGGGAVLHGPGQLAVNVCLPLGRLGWTGDDLRTRLETAVVSLLAEQQIAGWVRPEVAGVWTRGGLVAQTGISVRNGVSRFGFTLNVCPRMDLQRFICGPRGVGIALEDDFASGAPAAGDEGTLEAISPEAIPHGAVGRLTSIAAQRQRVVAMSAIREAIVRHLARSLGTSDYHVYTGHPRLRRKTQVVDHA
jgi:lipoyl(octanoyl) transferase